MDGIYWTKGARERVWTAYRTLLASSAVPLQEIRIPTRSGETCVFACGSTQSPPLVLLHGGNTNSAMWLRSLSSWSQHFRIYAVDIIGDPGFSATTRPPHHTDDHALWLDDVFKSLDLRSADIVGASFGGWIALDFATRRQSAVGRLVLLAPAGIARPSIAATLEISTLMLMGTWGRRQALLRLFGLVNENLTDAQDSFLAFGSAVQLNALSRLKVPAPISDEQLRSLSARTLVVLGGKDILFKSDAVSRRLRELCPMVTVQIIPDAGHALVDPTELVCGFLSGIASS
jgi:pimeloyl-ACP methyl ester carboxylesterase